MEFRIFAPVWVLALTFASPVPGAQPAATTPARGGIAALATYRSAFDAYRPFRDEPMVSWRETNRAVGSLGGHMGQLRGSTGMSSVPQEASGAAGMKAGDEPKAPGALTDGMPASHAGHGGLPPKAEVK